MNIHKWSKKIDKMHYYIPDPQRGSATTTQKSSPKTIPYVKSAN
jgi:hypothetical protein